MNVGFVSPSSSLQRTPEKGTLGDDKLKIKICTSFVVFLLDSNNWMVGINGMYIELFLYNVFCTCEIVGRFPFCKCDFTWF